MFEDSFAFNKNLWCDLYHDSWLSHRWGPVMLCYPVTPHPLCSPMTNFQNLDVLFAKINIDLKCIFNLYKKRKWTNQFCSIRNLPTKISINPLTYRTVWIIDHLLNFLLKAYYLAHHLHFSRTSTIFQSISSHFPDFVKVCRNNGLLCGHILHSVTC